MTGFSPAQVAALNAKLDAAAVKQNPKGFDYIEAWRAIQEANDIFGHAAWDRIIASLKCVDDAETTIGKTGPNPKPGWSVGYICTVTITVRAGDTIVTRDGTGFGSGIDVSRGSAHEGAVKEAESDAMKRALMTFGNPFGLALYDKAKTNVARPPTKAVLAATKAIDALPDAAAVEAWPATVAASLAKLNADDRKAVEEYRLATLARLNSSKEA